MASMFLRRRRGEKKLLVTETISSVSDLFKSKSSDNWAGVPTNQTSLGNEAKMSLSSVK